MTYSTTINGITLTANPAVAQTSGPSGALIQFTSKTGTSASSGIKIQFSTPIKTFGVTVVGQTNPSHRLEAYDMGGRFIGQAIGTPTIPDMGKGGSDVKLSISGNPSAWIAWVVLVPPTSDYVGYKDVIIIPRETTPDEPPPTDVDLSKLIIIDTSAITRSYELGSLRAVPSQVVNIRNTSTDTSIQVDLTESPDVIGMSFSPAHFALAPSTTQPVTVTFDPVQLNTNPVTNILSQIVVDLSVAGAPPPPPPPPPPTQISWYEERFRGSPLQPWPVGRLIGPLPTYEQLFSNPTSTRTIDSINYGNVLTAPITLRWTQVITLTEIYEYTFTMVTDDGMRFYINDVITMNEWRDQDDLTRTKKVILSPGTYKFRVEYFNNGAGSTARFGYTSTLILQ